MMLQKFMIFMLMLNNLMFNLFNYPMILSLLLFLKVMILSLLINLLTINSWFSYILFLIFVGGVLILLMYIVSMVYNEKFFFNLNYLSFFLFFIFIIIYIYMSMNIIIFNFDFNSLSINYLNFEFNLNKFYNFPNNIINILLINYLFFLLIIVYKIINVYKGPLRTK